MAKRGRPTKQQLTPGQEHIFSQAKRSRQKADKNLNTDRYGVPRSIDVETMQAYHKYVDTSKSATPRSFTRWQSNRNRDIQRALNKQLVQLSEAAETVSETSSRFGKLLQNTVRATQESRSILKPENFPNERASFAVSQSSAISSAQKQVEANRKIISEIKQGTVSTLYQNTIDRNMGRIMSYITQKTDTVGKGNIFTVQESDREKIGENPETGRLNREGLYKFREEKLKDFVASEIRNLSDEDYKRIFGEDKPKYKKEYSELSERSKQKERKKLDMDTIFQVMQTVIYEDMNIDLYDYPLDDEGIGDSPRTRRR